jgi:hypothetical protein
MGLVNSEEELGGWRREAHHVESEFDLNEARLCGRRREEHEATEKATQWALRLPITVPRRPITTD